MIIYQKYAYLSLLLFTKNMHTSDRNTLTKQQKSPSAFTLQHKTEIKQIKLWNTKINLMHTDSNQIKLLFIFQSQRMKFVLCFTKL